MSSGSDSAITGATSEAAPSAVEPQIGRGRRLLLWLKSQLLVRSKREAKDLLLKIIFAVATLIVVLPFFLIIIQLAITGLGGLTLDFFTTFPGAGLTGGIRNALVGTILLVLVAGGVGIPLSVLGAVYINEYSPPGRIRNIVEFASDVLAGIPSIVLGAFGFAFIVVFLGVGMGLVSGGLTLAFMMIPTVLRTTQEALRQVPVSLREASLALGATKWTTTWRVTIRAAFPGIMTGVLLAIGRVMGETAPLIFTSGNSLTTPTSFLGPASWVASLPFTIWAYITDPRPYLQVKANSTALALLVIVLAVDVIANYLSRKVTRRLA
jgi:phosphate transport system permease protein